jgi:hypothetical protein
MQRARYFAQIQKAISPERLAPYGALPGIIPVSALANYFWNVALCEALYPVLHCVEVTLRNSIHHAAIAAFGDPMWFATASSTLLPAEDDEVIRVMKDLFAEGRIPASGDVIARLDFGFWTSLLRREYDMALWRRRGMLHGAFPQLPSARAPRKRLAQRFNDIRRLRNRAFHHEPIWHRSDLLQQHQGILEAIGWMNQATYLTVTTPGFDRFNEVYLAGSTPYQQKLSAILASLLP